MKFAAIDIGSNAVRLLIARPLDLNAAVPNFKAVEITRLPLRLGDDVFNTGEISERKQDLLFKAMKAFSYLAEIYHVDGLKAVATSAMRGAKNGSEIVKRIKKTTGIGIEIISGLEESILLQKTILTTVTNDKTYLHIDVGGGSTELTVIKNKKPLMYESFEIGTVRMLEKAIRKSEKTRMSAWLAIVAEKHHDIRAIGTGGNIVKLNALGNPSQKKPFTLPYLLAINDRIEKLNQYQRVYDLGLNPDRAQVIDSAGKIFIDVLTQSNVHKILVPNKGLKDGIILELWQNYFYAQNRQPTSAAL